MFSDCGSDVAQRQTVTSTTIEASTRKGEVTIAARQDTYPVGTKEITVVWHNGTNKPMFYGDPFRLEQWDGKGWADMKPVTELFLLPAYYLEPGESKEKTYPIGDYYSPLQAGRYRVAVYYHFDEERPVTGRGHPVYSVFEMA